MFISFVLSLCLVLACFNDVGVDPVIRKMDVESRCLSYEAARRFDSDQVQKKVYKSTRLDSLRVWFPKVQVHEQSVEEVVGKFKEYSSNCYMISTLRILTQDPKLKKEVIKEYDYYYSEGVLFSTLKNATFDKLLQPENVIVSEAKSKNSKSDVNDWRLTYEGYKPKISGSKFNNYAIETAAVTRNEFDLYKSDPKNRSPMVSDTETCIFLIPAGTSIDPNDSSIFPFFAKAIYLQLHSSTKACKTFSSKMLTDLVADWQFDFDIIREDENLAKVLVPPFHLFRANQPVALGRIEGSDHLNAHFYSKPGFIINVPKEKGPILIVLVKNAVVDTKQKITLELPKVSNYLTHRQCLFTAIAHAGIGSLFLKIEDIP